MGRISILVAAFIAFFLVFLSSASALTDIDACQVLSSAGETYILNASIDDLASSTCFSFTVNNITLDCAGFTINMSNIPSTVFSLGNFNNSVVKNCIVYAQNSDDNMLVATGGVSNFTYQNNSAYVVGKSWAGDANDNVVSITGNYFNQSCYHEITNEPSLRITGQYINYDNNIFDGYCNNVTYSGSNVFQMLNHSTITNSIFNIAGSADEPLTFHGLHGNLIDNITINATNLQHATAGMVGRFCCGTDNIFRNSKMYLNWTFNIYAVNYKGDNITWDNIYMEATGNQLTMLIMDYDNITIKNSIFKGMAQEVHGANVFSYPANNTLNNLVVDNVTSDKSISFTNATAGDSWNLTNSYYGGGVLLVNVSDAFLLKSSYLNYSSGNNLQLDSDSDSNTIYNNTFNVGNVVDSGTGNSYCVNGTGNTYTGGSAYSGSGLGTCPSPYINSCQTLSNGSRTYILNASIANRSGTCFTIGANNITLDCANFEIDGDLTGTDYGIDINQKNDTVIQNCFIKEFYNGIYVRGGSSNPDINTSLYNITSYNNVGSAPAGIYVTFAKNTIASNITVYNNSGTAGGYGFYALGSNNIFVNNIWAKNNSQYGIYLQNANNTVINNSITEKSGQRGISISAPCNNETIKNATIRDINYSSSYGLYVDRCNNIILKDIEVYNINSTGTSYGLFVDRNNNIVLSGIEVYDMNSTSISMFGMRISGANNTYAEKLVIHNVTNKAFSVATCNNITIVNSELYDNYVGMDLSIIYNTTLENISSHDNIGLDYRISAATGSACHSLRSFTNLTATDGKVPFFTNDTVDINPVPDNISGIYLCNATGSKIKNGIFDGEDGIFVYRSNNLEISNIFIREKGSFSLSSVNDSIVDNVSVYNTTAANFGNMIGGNNITLKNSVFRMDKSVSQYLAMVFCGIGKIDIINSTFYSINDIATSPFTSGALDTLVSPVDKLNITIINSYIYGNNIAFSIDASRYGNIDIYNSRIERNSTNSSSGAIYIYCAAAPALCWNNNTYNLYNTTLTDYYVNYSRLNIYWNLSVRNPLSASVKIYNLTGGEVASFSDSRGVWLLEYYVMRVNVRTNSTPHNLSASKTGYTSAEWLFNMTSNFPLVVTLAAIPSPPEMFFTGFLTEAGSGIANLLTSITDPTVSLLIGLGFIAGFVAILMGFAVFFSRSVKHEKVE